MTSMPRLAVDTIQFRRVLSQFCTGLVVVTGLDQEVPVGFTCQAFASLSLRPPLVMFAVARTTASWRRIRANGRCAVNILASDQQAVSEVFGAPGADKFRRVRWRPGRLGVPLIADALAHIECELRAGYDGGDHEIAVGEVLELYERPEPPEPLLYYRSTYRTLGGPGGGPA